MTNAQNRAYVGQGHGRDKDIQNAEFTPFADRNFLSLSRGLARFAGRVVVPGFRYKTASLSREATSSWGEKNCNAL